MYDSFEEMIENDPIHALAFLAMMEETITSGESIANTQAEELGFPDALKRPLNNEEQIELAERVQVAVKRSMNKLFSPIVCEKSLLLTAPLLMRHYIPKKDAKDVADDDSPVDTRYHAMAIEATLIIAMCLDTMETLKTPPTERKVGNLEDMLNQVLTELEKLADTDNN